MMPQVLEGQWEDIRAHDAELIGQRVRLTILPAESLPTQPQSIPTVPNYAVLEAMREADKIQEGMRPRPGSDAVAIIREGRAGAMYGYDADNEQSAADCS